MTQRRTHTRSSHPHTRTTRTRCPTPPNSGRPTPPNGECPTPPNSGRPTPPNSDKPKKNQQSATPRQRRKNIKRVLIAIAVLFVTLGIVAAIFIIYLSSRLNADVDDRLRRQLVPVESGKPFYMLLLGTNKASWRENNYGSSGSNYRSDSMILARIDPNNCQVTLVSLHEDTLVDLRSHGKQKISAAYSFGGAAYSVEVVSKLAGVPISHYAEINFDSFCSIVDRIGGIEVNVPINIRDNVVGFSLKAGRQALNGENALNLCRSRHGYDAYGDGDMYRAANQRMVLEAILKKVLGLGLPSRITIISSLIDSVKTDMSVIEIIDLVGKMKGFDPARDIYAGVEPTTSKYINGICYKILDTAKWKKMMKRVDEGLSPYASEKEDPTRGLAGKYANALAQSRYQASATTGSTSMLKTFVIAYANNNKISAAQDIATKFGLSITPVKRHHPW